MDCFISFPKLKCFTLKNFLRRWSSPDPKRSVIIISMEFNGKNILCKRGEKEVFSGLSIKLVPGEIIELHGPNGIGKTSLLRLISGISKPTHGTFYWSDGTVSEYPERHFSRITLIGSADALKPMLTVEENLYDWTWLNRPRPERSTIISALRVFGIDALADTPVRFLSAGQNRRLTLSRLLTVETNLWLLDEPTIALDSEAVSLLKKLLVKHCESGGMAVIATNNDMQIQNTRKVNLLSYARSRQHE